MTVKLLTELHLESLSLKEAAQARLSLHLPKRHFVRNHMSRLIYMYIPKTCRSPNIVVAFTSSVRKTTPDTCISTYRVSKTVIYI